MSKIPPHIEDVIKKIRRAFVTTSSKDGVPHIAVAVYDSDKAVGYQILGTVISKEVEAVLDGYAPAVEKAESPFPQEEFKLKIKVNEVLELYHGIHSDKNIL